MPLVVLEAEAGEWSEPSEPLESIRGLWGTLKLSTGLGVGGP
jgi:hypothetical protein